MMTKLYKVAGAFAAIVVAGASLSACSSDKNAAPEIEGTGEALLTEMPTAADTDITAEELQKKLADENNQAILLDVRTLEEYNEGHIAGAINLDAYTVTEERIKESLPDKTAEYILYCRTGKRATGIGQILRDNGYSNVKVLGGIETDWNGEVVTN